MVKITVIVAVYNGGATMQRCIDSFTAQSYPHKELIVIDGGSKDETLQILTDNQAHLFYWISEPDQGIYDAWNKGVARATGEWICFLGSDDKFWSEDVLAKLAERLEPLPKEIKVAYGKAAVVSKSGDLVRLEGQPWEQAKKTMCHTMSIPHTGLMHRRSLFEIHGNFDPTFRILGDYDLLMRELKTGRAQFFPDVTTVAFQHGGVSSTPLAMKAVMREMKRVHKTHNLYQAQMRHFSMIRLKITVCSLLVDVIGDKGFRWIADAVRRLTGRTPVWREDGHSQTGK